MVSNRTTTHSVLLTLLFSLFGPAILWASSQASVGSIMVDGVKRTYLLTVPANHDSSTAAPLLIALHGGLGNGRRMVKLTRGGFDALADEKGTLVVYPNGIERHWNDGRRADDTGYSAHRGNADDVGFISALIDQLSAQWNLDRQRIYVTGISNGSMMSHRLACELSHKITAIAAVDGSMPLRYFPSCKPARPISVLAISNDKDPLMPFSGGDVTGPFGHKKLGKVLSASDTMAFWSKHNHCSPSPVVTREPDLDKNDGTQIRKETYINCKGGIEVIHYVIENGGHTWPGGHQYMGKWLIGPTSRDMDANRVIWHFFEEKNRIDEHSA